MSTKARTPNPHPDQLRRVAIRAARAAGCTCPYPTVEIAGQETGRYSVDVVDHRPGCRITLRGVGDCQ